jgi:Flp pilus assembly protein TadD
MHAALGTSAGFPPGDADSGRRRERHLAVAQHYFVAATEVTQRAAPEPYEGLAAVHFSAGETAAAITVLEYAQSIAPGRSTAWAALGNIAYVCLLSILVFVLFVCLCVGSLVCFPFGCLL